MSSHPLSTKILNESQLKRLSEHKYSAGGVSLLEPFIQPFWRWLVEQVPLWVAPNLMTITGLIVNVVSSLILVYYSPDAKSELPAWTLVLAALGLFLYQTLDAMDGKQARRTNSSSPLGELFDHGCDSVSMLCVTVGITISLSLGDLLHWFMFINFMSMFVYYCAHWQTFVSGTLKFGLVDVTEGQYSVIAGYLLTALFGSQIWKIAVPVVGLETRHLMLMYTVGGFLVSLKNNFSVIFLEGGIGKNKSTVAGTSVISPVFPMALMLGVGVMVALKSPSHLYENYPCLYILTFGIVFSKLINRLVISHMTKSKMVFWDVSLIGPALLVVNQYFDCVLSEHTALCIALVLVVGDLCWFSYLVCVEICEYLAIYCFVITSRPPRPKIPHPDGNSVDDTAPGSN